MSHTIEFLDLLFLLDGANVLDAEWQHILVVDGIDDRMSVQLLAERLLGRPQIRLAAAYGVLGKIGVPVKPKRK